MELRKPDLPYTLVNLLHEEIITEDDLKQFSDAVGMSTVPETMVCNYLGMKVLAVSCITNMATGIQTVKHSHARVLEIVNQAGETLCRWLGAVIQKMEG